MEKALEVLTDMRNIYKSDPRIKQALEEVKEAMKTKTCDGCKYASYDDECEEYYYSSDTYECRDCYRSGYKDNFMAKDNA